MTVPMRPTVWPTSPLDADGPGRILIVEDEAIVAHDLADTLCSMGHAVLAIVDTGEEAVSAAISLAPDLVLMDIRLAGTMDGIQAAEQIRTQRDVAVIYLTAHSDQETTRRARETGPFGYLVKPSKAPDLRCAIEIARHRHAIDARLRAREQSLATMLRSMGEDVMATDPELKIKLLNPVAGVVGLAPSWNGADVRLAPDHASAGPAGDRSARGRARSRTDLRLDHQLLLDLGEVMRGAADDRDVLCHVSTQLGRYLGASRCRFAQVDLAADRVTAHRGYTAGAPPVPDHLVLSLFGHEIAAAAARGETVVYCDTSTDPRTAAVFEGAYGPIATRAVVLVPLMRDQRWVAYLVVASSTPRTWSDREVTLVKLVADRAWMWSEHHRVVGERQRTEARYQGLVDCVTEDAIFMLDPNGNVATWNAGAERLKGYRSDEIIGEPLHRFYPPEDRVRAQAVLDRAVRSGRHEEEGWRLRKDGTRFWASVLLTPIFARDGSLEGFAKVTRDATDRRRHEDELRQQQAIIVDTRRERDALLQEVEHRVKNNLQVITSLINMQMRQLEPGAARDELADCRARVFAIAFTHEQLYRSQDYASVRFRDHVEGMIEHILQASDGSAQRITMQLAIDDVPLGIDQAIPCALVINELVINALQHGFAGDRCGTIRVELTALGGGGVRLAVRDDGAGLPAEFDIHGARSMGLQLVSTLAEQLGATLAVTRDAWTSVELTFTTDESAST